MPKKTERGDPLGFFNIHSVAKHQKNAGGTLWGKFFFRKKSLAVPKKNERGESLVSPGKVCYAEKQEKPFWFSSLDQIVHFDAIIFCRTFVELFWSVRVDRKKKSHYNSRDSLHEAPTRNDGSMIRQVLLAISKDTSGDGKSLTLIDLSVFTNFLKNLTKNFESLISPQLRVPEK